MERLPRKAYTYEFKQEAVRLVESGQRVAEVARSLGVVEQTLSIQAQQDFQRCSLSRWLPIYSAHQRLLSVAI